LEELPNSLVDLGWFARSFARLKRFSSLGLGGVTLDGGDPNSEGAGGLGFGHSSFYGIHDLPTEVFGIGFHQCMMPCSPSLSQHAVSLYLERSKVLIAGDALRAERGSLNGPNPSMTLEMGTALQSIRRLADLEIDIIVCYHGGVVSEDANGQLRRVIQEISHERDQ